MLGFKLKVFKEFLNFKEFFNVVSLLKTEFKAHNLHIYLYGRKKLYIECFYIEFPQKYLFK